MCGRRLEILAELSWSIADATDNIRTQRLADNKIRQQYDRKDTHYENRTRI